MDLKLEMTEKVDSIESFIQTIKRKNSQFVIKQNDHNIATIYFKPPSNLRTLFVKRNSVRLVKGVIDKSVLYNLNPSIKLKCTVYYRIFQIAILILSTWNCIRLLVNKEYVNCLFNFGFSMLFLAMLYLALRLQIGVFHGELFDEIRYGKNV